MGLSDRFFVFALKFSSKGTPAPVATVWPSLSAG
jgi:hypothetical protein